MLMAKIKGYTYSAILDSPINLERRKDRVGKIFPVAWLDFNGKAVIETSTAFEEVWDVRDLSFCSGAVEANVVC